MTSPIKLNLKVYQGSTFIQVLRWESSRKSYAVIDDINNSAPVVITAPGHDVPLGWRAKVTNLQGMPELVSLGYQIVTDITPDTVIFNHVNSLAFKPYVQGGILEYNTPVPLDDLVARMQIRDRVKSSAIIYELNTENGGVEFDTTNYTITLFIPDEVTADFNFTTAVYNLEFENVVSGVTTPFAKGTITLEKEVTR